MKGTMDYGITYSGDLPVLEGYIDASWTTSKEKNSQTSVGSLFTERFNMHLAPSNNVFFIFSTMLFFWTYLHKYIWCQIISFLKHTLKPIVVSQCFGALIDVLLNHVLLILRGTHYFILFLYEVTMEFVWIIVDECEHVVKTTQIGFPW